MESMSVCQYGSNYFTNFGNWGGEFYTVPNTAPMFPILTHDGTNFQPYIPPILPVGIYPPLDFRIGYPYPEPEIQPSTPTDYNITLKIQQIIRPRKDPKTGKFYRRIEVEDE